MHPIDPVRSRRRLTSGALGVLLDVLALLDELVLGGAGEAALGRDAELRGDARGGAGELSGGRHGERCCSFG